MENVLNDTVRPALSTQALSIAEFDEVVRTHQRRVYRVLVLLVRDLDEADTLTQECFLRAYQSLSRFRGECSVQTWLPTDRNQSREGLRSQPQGSFLETVSGPLHR
jgi:RNA polymerase sigma-70 factor (ECF subfamily)